MHKQSMRTHALHSRLSNRRNSHLLGSRLSRGSSHLSDSLGHRHLHLGHQLRRSSSLRDNLSRNGLDGQGLGGGSGRGGGGP